MGDGYYEKKRKQNVLIEGTGDSCYLKSEIASFLLEPLPSSYSSGKSSDLWVVKTAIKVPLKKTHERTVPTQYFNGHSGLVRGYLRGLYSANGSVVSTRVTLKAASRKVIDRVQQMLSSLGIASYVTTNAAHNVQFNNGEYLCRKSYDLNIGTYAGRHLFRSLIGFLQPYKTAKLDAVCAHVKDTAGGSSKRTYAIVSRKPLGVLPVYDITVDDPDHTYWTGGLLVSNCGEQPLEDGELCCLGELNPNAHETLEDFLQTIKYAYMYCKAVTLIPTNRPKTNQIITKNRRIGLSMMGIFAMYDRLGLAECIRWWDTGYNEIRKWDKTYSQWLGVNESIKVSTVKPGGSVPLVAGEEGGMKIPIAKFYFRTIRVEQFSTLVSACRAANYRIETDRASPRTVVIYFPVADKTNSRTSDQVSLWEQAELLAALQAHWSDNMVSNTLTFQPHEAKDIARVISAFSHRVKGMSFLPLSTHGYAQAPYIPISKEEYEYAAAGLLPLDLSLAVHEVDEKYCQGGLCEIVPTR